MISTSSFRRRPESSNSNIPHSGQNRNLAALRDLFNRLDSGLRRNDGILK